MSTTSIRPQPQRLAFIDALRGFAASYVMLFHFYNELSTDANRHQVQRLPLAVHEFVTHGMLGVDVFFVLSGFVISLSVRDYRVTPRFIGKFALRRSLRLDPLYWIVIWAMYVILLVGHGKVGAATGTPEVLVVLANMLYLDNLVGVPSIVHVGWTLCLEFQFYLVYIILQGVQQQLGKVVKRAARWIVFLPVALWSLAVSTHLVPSPTSGLFIDAWFLFFLGVVASWVTTGVSRAWLGAFVLAAAALVVRFDLAMLVAAGTSALIILAGDKGRKNWLNYRPLQYLGRISYSLYLVHPLVGHRITRWGKRHWGDIPSAGKSILLYAAAMLASLIVAHLLYILVERPTLNLARRVKLGEKRAPEAALL